MKSKMISDNCDIFRKKNIVIFKMIIMKVLTIKIVSIVMIIKAT